jgi:hypothetical protein
MHAYTFFSRMSGTYLEQAKSKERIVEMLAGAAEQAAPSLGWAAGFRIMVTSMEYGVAVAGSQANARGNQTWAHGASNGSHDHRSGIWQTFWEQAGDTILNDLIHCL